MTKIQIKEILLKFGYKSTTVDEMFKLRTRPKLLKAIQLEKIHSIPCIAWENIKSFCNSYENDIKNDNNASSVKVEKITSKKRNENVK